MKNIELSDEDFKKVQDFLGADSFKEISFYEDLVGEKIFFRTVTYHAVGEVKKIVGHFVHLQNASWVADTGRFMNFLKEGVQEDSEIEPTGDMFLNLDTVVDFFYWRHQLPKTQK